MSPLDPDRLAGLVVEALERIAFVIVDACEEDDLPGPFAAAHRARIAITGSGEGRVRLEADDGFVSELAAGLLGCDVDEVDAATTGREALSELANIVGGSVVVALGGKERSFRLGLPETFDADADAGDDASAGDDDATVHALLASDEGAIRVSWYPGTTAGEHRAAA